MTSGGVPGGGSAGGGSMTAGGAPGGGSAGGGSMTSGGTAGGGSAGGGSAGGSATLPDFVVVRVGDGSAALSSAATAVFLERRSLLTGAVLETLALPDTAFTLSGTASADGAMSRSPDGRSLALFGHSAPAGTASVQTSTAPRVVAAITRPMLAGTVPPDLSTTTGSVFDGVAPRCAVIDGNNVWVGSGHSTMSASGVYFTIRGAITGPTNLGAASSSLRTIGIAGGALYFTSAGTNAGLLQFGTGLPTMTGNSATMIAPTPQPYGFAFFDRNPNEPGLDLLYLADEGAGLKRFTKSAGTWTQTGTFTPAVRHIACAADGADVVCAAASSSQLYFLRDVNAASTTTLTSYGAFGAPLLNTAFRGMSLAPIP